MKRCPQCQFVYEDDQNLCDMDGAELVFDSNQFPAAITSFGDQVKKPRSRGKLTVVLLAGFLIGAIGLTAFYASTRGGNDKQDAPAAAASRLPSIEHATPVPTPSPNVPSQSAKLSASSSRNSASVNYQTSATSVEKSVKSERRSVPAEPTKPAAAPRNRKPAPSSDKRDSPVESFLKKTGRILKKPFKL